MEMRGLFVGGVLCFQRLGVVLLGCQGMVVGFLFVLWFVYESIQRATARAQPVVLEHEERQHRMANANKHVVIATKFLNVKYLFHQLCGS